jgi:activator of HSP90 ATPase
MAIHQEETFHCSAARLYEALTNAEQFGCLTETTAEIDLVVGGKFNCFNGWIHGVTVEMITNQRLVQAWRAKTWRTGIYSIISFKFEAISDTETKIIFDQIGFPQEDKTYLELAWHDKYWNQLKSYLNA